MVECAGWHGWCIFTGSGTPLLLVLFFVGCLCSCTMDVKTMLTPKDFRCIAVMLLPSHHRQYSVKTTRAVYGRCRSCCNTTVHTVPSLWAASTWRPAVRHPRPAGRHQRPAGAGWSDQRSSTSHHGSSTTRNSKHKGRTTDYSIPVPVISVKFRLRYYGIG